MFCIVYFLVAGRTRTRPVSLVILLTFTKFHLDYHSSAFCVGVVPGFSEMVGLKLSGYLIASPDWIESLNIFAVKKRVN